MTGRGRRRVVVAPLTLVETTSTAVEHTPLSSQLLAALGVEPGTVVTLVQFSSAFCAPCRATRQVLGEVTRLLDGVRHVEVDAESHLSAVRALDIRRTPTVLVIDGAGRVVRRAAGVPAKAQVIAAVAPLLTVPTPQGQSHTNVT